MHDSSILSWREQYDRMLRSRDRILGDYNSSVAYKDDLVHFIQDSWHLKDWIKNDASLPPSICSGIEGETKKQVWLNVVADLANRSKHLVLDRNVREDAKLKSENVTVHIGQNRPADVEYVFTTNTGVNVRRYGAKPCSA